MNNIISAIINLVENPNIKLVRKGSSRNRANNMGEALEEYIKDLFANTVGIKDEQIRNVALATTFSYLGNQNNPPDCILHGGDAIEVKKIESKNSALALNSSYPKAKLFANSPMINKACKECESWVEKDIIYAAGVVDGQNLTSLAFVYGEDYCANKEIYENIINRKNSDPLNMASPNLLQCGWEAKNSFEIFNYVYNRAEEKIFDFMCVVNTDKFDTFDNAHKLYELAKKNKKLEVHEVRIKNPNNRSQFKEAKLITFYKEAA